MASRTSHLMTLLRLIPVWLEDGDRERLTALFAENAVWEGPQPGLVCSGRDAIADRLHRAAARGLHLSAIDLRESGDRVIVHAEGPDLPAVDAGGFSAGAPRSLAFTFRNGLVVHLQTLPPA